MSTESRPSPKEPHAKKESPHSSQKQPRKASMATFDSAYPHDDSWSSDEESSPLEEPRFEEVSIETQSETASLDSSMKKSLWGTAKRVYSMCRVFRNKSRYPWVQLAGHAEGFKVTDPSSGWILKDGNPLEKAALETLMTDPLKDFVPGYDGATVVDGHEYLKLKNLLTGFSNPCVMDCKIGVRTFLENETNTSQLRMDLLKKIIAVDPNEPTAEEKEKGVTKLRYMQFRERESSTSSVGFRIEALKVQGATNKDLKKIQSREQVVDAMRHYLSGRGDIARKIHDRLLSLRAALLSSPFFPAHEIIGSSLLFVYDTLGKANVWMIDFGKTMPSSVPVRHDVEWVANQHSPEDGYLIGLGNLIAIIEEIISSLPSPHSLVEHPDEH